MSKCLVCGNPDGERAYCIYFDGEGLCRECMGWAMGVVIGWWREYEKTTAVWTDEGACRGYYADFKAFNSRVKDRASKNFQSWEVVWGDVGGGE